MYKKVYRQEGGLAEQGDLAPIREAARKKIEEFNRRNKGEVAQRVRAKPAPRPAARAANIPVDTERLQGLSSIGESKQPSIIDRAKNLLPNINIDGNQLFNQDQIIDLAVKYGEPTGSTGKPSDARHRAVVNEISKKIAGPSLPYPTRGMPLLPIQDIIGDIGSFGAGLMNEFPALFRGFSKENVQEIIEDVISNWKGSFGTSNLTTPEQIYEEVYKEDEGGLASLPEAQADEPWSTTDWNTFVSKRKEDPDTDLQYIGPKVQPTVNPLDYQNEFNFRRNYLSDYIDSSQDKFGDEGKLYSYGYIPEVSPMYNATQETGRSFDPQIFSEYQKASDAADRAWGYRYNPEQNTTVNIQPTGFAETGYGQFSPQPTTNIEVPPEVAQNVAVSVTTPGYYNYQEGLNRVLYPGLSGSTGFQNQQQVLPSLMK